nr:cobalt-precorrin-7 (C(5))-methyltransferase [uncultured Peptostreptococcus sp.]
MVYIVGVGPGSGLYLSRMGEDIIKRTQLIIGGQRNIDFIRSSIGIYSHQDLYRIGSNLGEMINKININIDKDIVVLASGDPSIYGIADYIRRNMVDKKVLNSIKGQAQYEKGQVGQVVGHSNLEIVPGISSIQYAFSIFQIPMNDLYISSSHGRLPDYDFIFTHDKVVMLTDSNIGPREIAKEVEARKENYTFYVGENLSYPNQRLTVGLASDILSIERYDMCVVILVRWREKNEK